MKICLIKISGKAISSFSDISQINTWLSNISQKFDGIVIVHGAGKEITEWSDKFGIESKFVDGQRVTTKEQIKIVAAVQAGLINSQLCAKINAAGFSASGYSGIDRNTFVVNLFTPGLGFVGAPYLNNSTEWINNLLKEKTLPVFSSICRDNDGNLVNVNADIFSGYLAMLLKVSTVLFLSDVEGVILNNKIENQISAKEIKSGIKSGEITDGMIPKLTSCISLLKTGIENLWIGSSLDSINFDNQKDSNGNGTWITNSEQRNNSFKKTA
jgi:acetylglutamate kinase